jgi:hypothetical protein
VKASGDSTYRRIRYEDCLLLPRSFHRKIIPDELEDEFFDLIDLIGKKNLMNFQVCIDGTISITIKSEVADFAEGWYWEKLHKLEYKPKDKINAFGYEVIRDTILSERIRYYVCLYNS